MSRHVLIAGAGIAGPLLALFLRKAGISSAIYEAEPEAASPGGGIGLAENGMAVLRAAGLTEAVHQASVRVAEWAFENHKGELLARLPQGKGAPPDLHPVLISRRALHRLCADAAANSGVAIHYGKRVSAVSDEEGRPVVIRFEDGSTASGDLLVGADGIRSTVRRLVLPEAPKPSYTGLLAPGGFGPSLESVRLAPQAPVCLHFRFGRKGFFGYAEMLSDGEPKTLWWSTAPGELPDRTTVNGDCAIRERRGRLQQIHEGWGEPVKHLIEQTETILPVAIHDVPSLPAWSAGRTVLVGDAAHAVAPHSGQGASMALEDAMLLAKLLRDSKDDRADKVFRSFEQQRRPRTDRVIAMGRRNAANKQEMSPMEYRVKQLAMRYLVPLASRRRPSWLLDYRVEW